MTADQTEASSELQLLLRAVLSTVGRSVFSVTEVYSLVNPTGRGTKQVGAYNLADGKRTQAEIAALVKLDQGQLSRTMARWVDAGIMFRVSEGHEARFLHLYPIPEKGPGS